jgi:DNA polymerase-3 subunit gamma/tau
LLDQAIAYCGGTAAEADVADMLGTIDRGHVNRLIELLAAGDAPGLMAVVAEVDEQFPDYARLLEDLTRLLQRIAVYQVIGATDLDDELDEEVLAGFAASLSAEDVQLFYQIGLLGIRDLHLAPDPRSGVEMTLLRMLAFQPGATGTGGTSLQAKKVARKTMPAPEPESQTHEPGPAARAEAPDNAEDWTSLVDGLPLSGLNRQLANNCAFIRREDDTIYLGLDGRTESYLTRDRQAAVAKAVSEYFGRPVKVDIAVGTAEVETPVQQAIRREDERHAAAREGLEADPNVQALKDMFGAELVPDSVEPLDKRTASNQE